VLQGWQARHSWKSLHRVRAIELRDRRRRYLDLFRFPEREYEECSERSRASKRSHPPDVPDQCEASDHGKECSNEGGGSVSGHLNVFVFALRFAFLLRCVAALFFGPESIEPVDARQNREIPGRRR